MFVQIYNAALQAKSFSVLKKQMSNIYLDVKQKKPPYFTPAGKLAANGKVRAAELLCKLGASANHLVFGYALAGNHAKVEHYLMRHFPINMAFVIQGYAYAGNHAKVEEFRERYSVNVNTIAYAYAFAGNHAKVEEYRINHQACVNHIAHGYAVVGNHAKVEEYRANHQACVNAIAYAYAAVGNHAKVEEYRVSHQACVSTIAEGYAYALNHAKVEEYQEKYQASPQSIQLGYMTASLMGDIHEGNDIPDFNKATFKLRQCGTIGREIIKVMRRLQEGQNNYWNPYWINSGEKLDAIIKAINTLKVETLDDLKNAIESQGSKLYKALNMQRLSPLTFLGRFGISHAKSYMVTEDSLSMPFQL